MQHLDDQKLRAYLEHSQEFGDPAVRRASAQHIVDCPDCARRLKEAQQGRSVAHLDERQPHPGPIDHAEG